KLARSFVLVKLIPPVTRRAVPGPGGPAGTRPRPAAGGVVREPIAASRASCPWRRASGRSGRHSPRRLPDRRPRGPAPPAMSCFSAAEDSRRRWVGDRTGTDSAGLGSVVKASRNAANHSSVVSHLAPNLVALSRTRPPAGALTPVVANRINVETCVLVPRRCP